MNKPYSQARRLGDLVGRCLSKTLARQGFASTELVTRWAEIVGPEIAAHAEPVKIQWARHADADAPEPATLVLRVEGPVAIEIPAANSARPRWASSPPERGSPDRCRRRSPRRPRMKS